jgi:hypothetical protein
MAIGLFCGVIGVALAGFGTYHLYLVYYGTTTNETFKWSDLKAELKRRKKQRQEKASKRRGKGSSTAEGAGPESLADHDPKNIYDLGFLTNLGEVIYPLSCRPCNGFDDARATGGAMVSFPRARGQPARGTEEDGSESEDVMSDSDDPDQLPGVVKAHAD